MRGEKGQKQAPETEARPSDKRKKFLRPSRMGPAATAAAAAAGPRHPEHDIPNAVGGCGCGCGRAAAEIPNAFEILGVGFKI